jgi:hypothetical protein
MRSVAVFMDRRPVLALNEKFERWREARMVDLRPYLSPGQHELVLAVVNSDGPAVALAYSAALGLRTGPDWETSLDYKSWKGAATVDDIRPPEFILAFPTVKEAFVSRLPYFSVVFAVVFLWTLGLEPDLGASRSPDPRHRPQVGLDGRPLGPRAQRPLKAPL